jgi:hypothetical protein
MKTPKRPSSIPQLVLPEYSFVSGVDYVSVLPVNRSWFVVGRTYSREGRIRRDAFPIRSQLMDKIRVYLRGECGGK